MLTIKNYLMKKIQKILIDFVNYTDAVLVQFVQAVILALTGNPNFATPQPTIAVLTAALDDFQAAISDAEMGGPTERAIREQKRDALIILLRQLALYIQMVSGGDVAMMLSSAMNVSKLPSPVGPLPKPNKFVVSPYRKGMLTLSLERIIGANTYLYQYRLVTEMVWQNYLSNRSKIILTGLESGKEYVCRVLPSGASDIKVYSDEVNSFVM
jgi:hypothetical protein